MHSTKYVIKFVIIMTLLVALILSLMSTGLKSIHSKNEAVFNKKAILASVNDFLPGGSTASSLSAEEVERIFSDNITQKALKSDGTIATADEVAAAGYPSGLAEDIDTGKERKKPYDQRIYPLFIYSNEGKSYYITSVRGSGLWDEIWASVAISDDYNTIVGISFDHKSETPGLGAEIKDNPAFGNGFKGKKLFNSSGVYKSVEAVKGGIRDQDHQVDVISGATITVNGVSEMLYNGIKVYIPYFESIKNK